MYVMVCTRLDIGHVVGVVSRFMSNPGKAHWEAVKWILRYIQGTKEKCFCFSKGELKVHGYVDADFAGEVDHRRSTTNYLLLVLHLLVGRRGYKRSFLYPLHRLSM